MLNTPQGDSADDGRRERPGEAGHGDGGRGAIRVAVSVDVTARGDVIAATLMRFADVEVVPCPDGPSSVGHAGVDVAMALATADESRVAPAVEQMIADLAGFRDPPSVIAVACKVDAEDARRALAAGAHGYVTMADGIGALEDAVRTVAAGGSWIGSPVGVALVQEDALMAGAGLQPRERDILRLVALGYTNAEAASELCFSVRTIETVRGTVCRRLGISSRRELVAAAFDLGLLRDRAA